MPHQARYYEPHNERAWSFSYTGCPVFPDLNILNDFYNREKHDLSLRHGGEGFMIAGRKVLIVAAILLRWMTIVKDRFSIEISIRWRMEWYKFTRSMVRDISRWEIFFLVLFLSNERARTEVLY